jgi:hypothetical protein
MGSKGQSFLLCNTYRSPCTDIDYWTRLTYAIELALQVNENIIITGDLNSNLLCSNNKNLLTLWIYLILRMWMINLGLSFSRINIVFEGIHALEIWRKVFENSSHISSTSSKLQSFSFQFISVSNLKMYWKIMKMLIKSNKGNYCIPPLRNPINDQNIDDIAYDDSDKCELLKSKLFSNFSFAVFFILFTLFLCFLYLIMLFSFWDFNNIVKCKLWIVHTILMM